MDKNPVETNETSTGKKRGRPRRISKAEPWAIRVDQETRRLITKTASQQNKTLEEFFKTNLGEYCQQLLSQSPDQTLSPLNEVESTKFVSLDDFNKFKMDIIATLQPPKNLPLLKNISLFLFGTKK